MDQEQLSSTTESSTGSPEERAVTKPRGQPAPPPEPKVVLHPDTEYTGAILRQVREAQGVELLEITARTKIGMSYLKAIELEDFASLPALVYTRGFVGEIAKFLELDHQQVVKTYIKRFQKYLEETGKLD
jgi:flagellar biosynthesis protein FlhG